MPNAFKQADLVQVEAFIKREARLLDEMNLVEWLTLFTADGLYWIPMDDNSEPSRQAALVYDDAPRRKERVYHLKNLPFPAQSPPSRIVHAVSNVEIIGFDDLAEIVYVRSVQIIWEMRVGDFTQIGLGTVRPLVSTMFHDLKVGELDLRIIRKKILLIDRDMPQSNLTFIV